MAKLDLQQRIAALESEVESWERALMAVVGEDGVKSAPAAILAIKQERDSLRQRMANADRIATELADAAIKLAEKACDHFADSVRLKQERDVLQHQVDVLEVLKGQKDERIAQLEEQVNALAAENLSLLDFDWVSFNEDGPYEPGEVEALLPNTRATDAIKRQWMADGLLYAIKELPMTMSMAGKLNDLSVELRQPEEKGHE